MMTNKNNFDLLSMRGTISVFLGILISIHSTILESQYYLFLEKQADRLKDVTSLAQSHTVGMSLWHTNWVQVCLPPSPGFFSMSSFLDVQVFSSLVCHTLWWNNSQAPSQVRTECGTTDWFQIGKGVCQGGTLSPCLFNLYAECIMWNARLDEAQAGIKISGRNINNLRHAEWHHHYGRKQRGTKEPLDEGERGECKSWLKTQHLKN